MQDYQEWMINSGKATFSFSSIAKKAGSLIKGFGAALGSMGINWAIGEIIGFAANAIDDYIHRAERIKEAAEQSKSAIDSIKSNFNSLKSTVNDSSQRFAELAQGVDNLGKSNQLSLIHILIRVQCRLHSGIIHLKIKRYSRRISRLILSVRQLTRQEDGFIRFLQYLRLYSIRRRIRM